MKNLIFFYQFSNQIKINLYFMFIDNSIDIGIDILSVLGSIMLCVYMWKYVKFYENWWKLKWSF